MHRANHMRRTGKKENYHRGQELETGKLNIPAKLGDGPSDPTKGEGIVNGIVEVMRIVGGLV